MKLLLILGSDDNYDTVCRHTQSLGFEVIRYRHVLKAVDNIDEIEPQAIIVSARDFPLHWKMLLQFVRSERPKETCPIIILKGMGFNTEEISKAFFLGANGVLSDTLENGEDIDRMRGILARPMQFEDQKQFDFPVEPWHRFGLLIANFSGALINAEVRSVSSGGLSFVSLNPLPPKPVQINTELNECSLRAGDSILSPICRISDCRSNGLLKTISLEFSSFPPNEQNILNRYLETLNTRDAGIR